jgi:hypothetical protein
LLTATVEIFSSLAAHAEVNYTSGSKLCMLFGLWLPTAYRIEDKDDWQTFCARWERTGRMLELEINPSINACPTLNSSTNTLPIVSYHGFITFSSSTFY